MLSTIDRASVLTGFEIWGIEERYKMDGNGTFRKTLMGMPRQKPMESMCRD
jgi:hypothetical protein